LTQLGLLLGLWWRRLRRRPLQVGAAPRPGGTPTYLLLNLLVLGNLLPSLFLRVRADVTESAGFFAFHLLGVVALAFGTGLNQGAGVSFDGAQRGDALAQVLPLSLFARLGAQLAASYQVLLFTLAVPLAAASAAGLSFARSALALLLGLAAFVLISLLAQALLSWARAFSLPGAQRYGTHLGTACMVLGGALCFAPLHAVVTPRAAWLLSWCISDSARPLAVLAVVLAALPLSYFALQAAERQGFDRLEAVQRAPRVGKGVPSRRTLELRMITRQGGLRQLAILSVLLFAAPFTVPVQGSGEMKRMVLLGLVAFAVYVGGLQIIGQAGMAVRRDLRARAFLSALPLSPYQVLESKSQVLRLMLIPAFAMLAFMLSWALALADYGMAYRIVLALVALYGAVDGATGVAFMSHGVGMVGTEGGETTSSFFTFLLLLPLIATIVSPNAWGASMALLAVLAIAHEAQRAARNSVRWLDDPDAALSRDTGVWRALLVVSAFFTTQGFSSAFLLLLGLSEAFALAIGFGLSSLLLVMLTQRATSGARSRIRPERAFYWLLGGAGGLLTATFARAFARYVLPSADLSAASLSSLETIALGVATILVAPIAEEYFFRGWLQTAIEHDLPAAKKRWAFALAALAFAMAHVGSYGLPQLAVGLVAGGLYARGRGLGPAMIAHAVHNGLVYLWPP
jgi:membrane protease YdiL (CAAX protease family)